MKLCLFLSTREWIFQTLIFTDVIGEVDGAHTIDFCYKAAAGCYECWKGLCYNILTICCGICIAAEWGCEFAYIAFCHIWFITPCLKICEINCGLCQRMYTTCVNCCITPVCEAYGGMFHHFRRGWKYFNNSWFPQERINTPTIHVFRLFVIFSFMSKTLNDLALLTYHMTLIFWKLRFRQNVSTDLSIHIL